jgi:hypothetical protein
MLTGRSLGITLWFNHESKFKVHLGIESIQKWYTCGYGHPLDILIGYYANNVFDECWDYIGV